MRENGIEYLGINLPIEVKDLASENYKTLMMEGHTMFLDLKNQYCENDHTTQGSL